MKFMAVKCCSCDILQVKQVKKAGNKWWCTVCNQTQSVRKVYITSDSAKDVRRCVQELNLANGLAAEAEVTSLAAKDVPRCMQELNLANGLAAEAQDMSVFQVNAKGSEDSFGYCCNKEDMVRVGYAKPGNLSKWQQFLPKEENLSQELLDAEQTSDKNFVTCLLDTPNHKRKSYHTSPARAERAMHVFGTPARDFEQRRGIAKGSKYQAPHSRPENLLRSNPSLDAGVDNGISLHQDWNRLAVCKSQSNVLPTSAIDGSLKELKSYPDLPFSRTQGPKGQHSRRSSYLT